MSGRAKGYKRKKYGEPQQNTSSSTSMSVATGYRKRSRLSGYNLKFHKFVRSINNGSTSVAGSQQITISNTGIITYAGTSTGTNTMQLNFALSGVNVYFNGVSTTALQMPSFTEFTSLYDQYRIDYVECQFISSNTNSSTGSVNTSLPIMYIAKDYDDSNAAAVTDLLQYSTCKYAQLGQRNNSDGIFKFSVKPNVDLAVYNGAVSGYARSKPIFMDCASYNVPHYGVKLAFDGAAQSGATAAADTNLIMIFKYHLTMSHTR